MIKQTIFEIYDISYKLSENTNKLTINNFLKNTLLSITYRTLKRKTSRTLRRCIRTHMSCPYENLPKRKQKTYN